MKELKALYATLDVINDPNISTRDEMDKRVSIINSNEYAKRDLINKNLYNLSLAFRNNKLDNSDLKKFLQVILNNID